MPLHRIYHPNTVFTEASEREAIANVIAGLYTAALPKFFVNVVFVPLDPTYIYTGGKPQTSWVRITVEHLAAQIDDLESVRIRAYDCSLVYNG